MDIKTIKIKNPNNLNLIFGQTHFIKTVEDIYEALVTTVPGIKFGLAFAEASGSRLVRTAGTDQTLEKLASQNILTIGAGHSFLIILGNCFPINVMPAIKNLAEVCHIFCATANLVEVIIYQTKQGRAILGVVDGESPKGIEKKQNIQERKDFLRKTLRYKF